MFSWQDPFIRYSNDLSHILTGKSRVICDRDSLFLWLALFLNKNRHSTVVITPDLSQTEILLSEVQGILPSFAVARSMYMLPEIVVGRKRLAIEQEPMRQRIFYHAGAPDGVFFASIMSFLAPAPDPGKFKEHQLSLACGEREWPPEKLAAFLVSLDYDNEALVTAPGEFSWRGGILDIYSPLYDNPIRLDYWGDSIESLRFFDPHTQRSLEKLDQFTIVPRQLLQLHSETPSNTPCFFDFFAPHDTQFIIVDHSAIESHLQQYADDTQLRLWEKFLAQSQLRIDCERQGNSSSAAADSSHRCPFYGFSQIAMRTLPEINDTFTQLQRQFLQHEARKWQTKGYRVGVCTLQNSIWQHFRDIIQPDERNAAMSIEAISLALPQGIVYPEAQLVLLSEADVLGTYGHKKTAKSLKSGFNIDYRLETGIELNEGEFAVHAAHGICRYLGLRKEQFHDRIQEVLVLEFDNEVKVFVPLEQAYMVSRYVGAHKKIPKLNRIGAAAWRRAKEEASAAVKDLAADLIRLQAIRAVTSGFSFGNPKSSDMQSFARSFQFQETPDQQAAIEMVLADMAQSRPMDRLVCGDVGYGKTEVAMRAAFNAVMANKQVAILVPTTILAQQHFLTFSDRFKAWPVIIDCLSRFRSPAQQRAILKQLSAGKIDIIIGTHRLLQKDVAFKDLGLVIVDEEQRFGVRHKERLKMLRANVDILTLTATPIPRTLYLAMAGLRDMSTIMSAPRERHPIHTVVAEFEEQIVREAITYELQRGGQVFYIHNRIHSITQVWEKLTRMFPDESIDVAHGRMPEDDLEAVMLRFIEGGSKILVCTTIVESGLDIPNANTMIIDRADRFGLAELYQLRGRVGRFHRQAYAYLLLPKNTIVLATAKQRLEAISKYTQLGAGFKLAIRDMEIRGTGNIIGYEQSGHIAAIGFNLYCQLLKQAVARLKNQQTASHPEIKLILDFVSFGDELAARTAATIPATYISDPELRVDCYRRLGLLTTIPALEDFIAELKDRFGAVPQATLNLCMVTRLKIFAHAAGIKSITTRNRLITMETDTGLVRTSTHRLPRLQSPDPDDFLEELCALVGAQKNTAPVFRGK